MDIIGLSSGWSQVRILLKPMWHWPSWGVYNIGLVPLFKWRKINEFLTKNNIEDSSFCGMTPKIYKSIVHSYSWLGNLWDIIESFYFSYQATNYISEIDVVQKVLGLDSNGWNISAISVVWMIFVCYYCGQLWHCGGMLDCRSTGWVVNPAPGACFIPKVIS